MFSDMSVQWLLLLILLVSTAFVYTTNVILGKETGIPGPRGWPVIGHLPLLHHRPFTVMGELFGYQRKDIIYSPTDDHWRFMRKLGSEFMSSKAIQKQQVTYIQAIQPISAQCRWLHTCVQCWDDDFPINHVLATSILHYEYTCKTQFPSAGYVSGRQELLDMMLTVIPQMLFGKRLIAGKSVAKSSESNIMKKLTQLFKELAKLDLSVLGDCFPFLRWLDVGGAEARIVKLHREFDNILSDAMNALRREAPPATSEDPGLMQTLLSMQRTEEGKNITDDEIKALVTDLFIAGIDTISSTLMFGMAELMRNPDVKEKLLKELDEVVGRERVVEESDLVNLKYLKMVIKETFRLHPPVPFLLPRKSMGPATVAGYKVPKDTQVLINLYAIQRSPESWDDPTSFKPERFANNPIDVKGQDFCLLPFGAGRRQCPGIGIGGLMVEITLATLLQILEFSLPAGMKPEDVDMTEEATITSALVSPLLVSVKSRLSPKLFSKRT